MREKHSMEANVFPFLTESKNYMFGDMGLEHKNENIKCTFGNFSIEVPKEKFKTFIERRQGQVTIGEYKFILAKKRQIDHGVHFDVLDKTSKEVLHSSGMVWSPHHNTPDWEQLIPWINKAKTYCSISISKRLNKIGISINNTSSTFGYSYVVALESENNKIHTQKIIDIANLFKREIPKPILIQSKEKVEDWIGIDINKESFFNMDDYFDKDDAILASSKGYIEHPNSFYDDDPFNCNQKIIKLYIDSQKNGIENSLLGETIASIKEMKKDMEKIIFPFEIETKTKHEKDIFLLDKKYIVKENENKIIDILNSKQINFKWGSARNMMPIEHILHYLIKNNMATAVKELVYISSKERSSGCIMDGMKNFKFLIMALQSNNENIIESIVSLYNNNEIKNKLLDLDPFNNWELLDSIESSNFKNSIEHILEIDVVELKILEI